MTFFCKMPIDRLGSYYYFVCQKTGSLIWVVLVGPDRPQFLEEGKVAKFGFMLGASAIFDK